jgi:hypothetical protein
MELMSRDTVVIGVAGLVITGSLAMAVLTNGPFTMNPGPGGQDQARPLPDPGYVCLTQAEFVRQRDKLMNDPIKPVRAPGELPEAEGAGQLIVVTIPDTPQGRKARLAWLTSNQNRCR